MTVTIHSSVFYRSRKKYFVVMQIQQRNSGITWNIDIQKVSQL